MTALIMGLVTAINIVVIIFKFKKNRLADATLDMAILFIIAIVFSGTISGLCIGTIASAFVSSYLWYDPVSLNWLQRLFDEKKSKVSQSINNYKSDYDWDIDDLDDDDY